MGRLVFLADTGRESPASIVLFFYLLSPPILEIRIGGFFYPNIDKSPHSYYAIFSSLIGEGLPYSTVSSNLNKRRCAMATHRVQQYKPGDFSLGQVHEFLGAFGRQGGTPKLLQTGIENSELMNRLVRFWHSGGYAPTTDQRLASEIMGRDFFGVEDAIEHFGVTPTRRQLEVLAKIPWNKEELRRASRNHVLVAVFPLSTLNIRKRVPREFFITHEDAWYNREEFARKCGTARWLLIGKFCAPGSLSNHSWVEQLVLLTEDEYVPTAQEVVYATIGHYLQTGDRLFEDIRVRTSDLGTTGGTHVGVGLFQEAGIDINTFFDYNRLGIATARKPHS